MRIKEGRHISFCALLKNTSSVNSKELPGKRRVTNCCQAPFFLYCYRSYHKVVLKHDGKKQREKSFLSNEHGTKQPKSPPPFQDSKPQKYTFSAPVLYRHPTRKNVWTNLAWSCQFHPRAICSTQLEFHPVPDTQRRSRPTAHKADPPADAS